MIQSVPVKSLFIVAFADPSGGKKRGHKHSRSAIVVLGMDALEREYLLLAWAAHLATSAYKQKIFDVWREWRPSIFGIDATGPQIAFAEDLIQEAINLGLRIPFRPIPLGYNKRYNIEMSLQPVAAQGRAFRPPEENCRELKAEWMAHPNPQGYADILDSWACARALLPRRAQDEKEQSREDRLRDYLRKSGATDEMIQKRLRQLRPSA